ncbi:MAG: PTS sugar transporter subunit IIC [Endomicrobium sp.]|jgi:mannose/fructose/N-acetylgalactosamine-specific phosphotransferase system component IIC|nr:PTS sugar transporter subunit IIC [Endomicrobium sp.]
MIIENIVILAFIAAVCSMDVTAFGQFMICRPIFCAPLFGYLMGDISIGLWIGMIVEMVWINSIPLGTAVPIDIASISINATFWACKYYPSIQEAAICALLFAVPFAYFYKEIDINGRNMNIRIMKWVENGIKEGKEWKINAGVFFSLFLFLLRAFIFYLIVMFLGGVIFQLIYLQIPAFVIAGLKKAWYLLPILGFGSVLYNFKNIRLPFIKR